MGCCNSHPNADIDAVSDSDQPAVGEAAPQLSSTRLPLRLEVLGRRKKVGDSCQLSQHQLKHDKEIIKLIRKHGRSYEPGEASHACNPCILFAVPEMGSLLPQVLITFGELLQSEPDAAGMLMRLRDDNQLSFEGESLVPGEDDEVNLAEPSRARPPLPSAPLLGLTVQEPSHEPVSPCGRRCLSPHGCAAARRRNSGEGWSRVAGSPLHPYTPPIPPHPPPHSPPPKVHTPGR